MTLTPHQQHVLFVTTIDEHMLELNYDITTGDVPETLEKLVGQDVIEMVQPVFHVFRRHLLAYMNSGAVDGIALRRQPAVFAPFDYNSFAKDIDPARLHDTICTMVGSALSAAADSFHAGNLSPVHLGETVDDWERMERDFLNFEKAVLAAVRTDVVH